jgi:hypothetical protein
VKEAKLKNCILYYSNYMHSERQNYGNSEKIRGSGKEECLAEYREFLGH